MRSSRSNRILALAGLCACSASIAPAISITRVYIQPAQPFVRVYGNGTEAPGSAVGGGNLVEIFDAAADYWESVFLDDHSITLWFGWSADISVPSEHRVLAQGGVPSRETEGVIRFSSAYSSWFLDPTPLDASEYLAFSETSTSLAGALLNVGRVYRGPTGDAAGKIDVFTVALHEIGHSLGLSSGNHAFAAEAGDRDIDLTAPRPFAGSSLPLTPGTGPHLNFADALMTDPRSPSERVLPSQADILAIAQISQFEKLNLDPHPTPEPGTLLFVSGAAAAVLLLRRMRRVG